MKSKSLAVSLLVGLLFLWPALGGAEEPEDEPGDSGFSHQSDIQLRATPIGVSLFSDTGYRWSFDYGEGDLFDGIGIETGIATSISPAYGWAGPYVELLPIAVLDLRAGVQAMHYWGAFGHLYVPSEDPQGQAGVWDDDSLDRAWDDGLGRSATGWQLHLEATPQILIDRWAVQIPGEYRRVSMGVDEPYYEPYLDMLMAPTEHLWTVSPTVGYLFGEDLAESFLLLGVRWERIAATQVDIVRDTVGVVWNWQLPDSLMGWGSPGFSGFAGTFIDHPTRGQFAPYVGLEVSLGW